MKFIEAIEELKAGKKIIRAGWTEADGYLVFMPRMKSIWKILTTPSVNAGNHLFTVEDFLAEDWEEANFEEKCDEPGNEQDTKQEAA